MLLVGLIPEKSLVLQRQLGKLAVLVFIGWKVPGYSDDGAGGTFSIHKEVTVELANSSRSFPKNLLFHFQNYVLRESNSACTFQNVTAKNKC